MDASRLHPSTSDSHHPLSPAAQAHPSINRRASSSILTQQQSYFDLPPTRQHAASISLSRPRKQTVTDAQLLGVGPSRLRQSLSPSTKASSIFEHSDESKQTSRPVSQRMDSGQHSLSQYLDSLSKDEIRVVETRFDLMGNEELEEYLDTGLGSELEVRTPRGKAMSPRTPMPREADSEDSLFPPSPPTLAQIEREHPLRILSRAVVELKEAVDRLEEENRRLRQDVRPRRSVDQASIHDSLTEALSTSLTSPTEIPRPVSPSSIAPSMVSFKSRSSVPQSPRPPSVHSTKSVDPPASSNRNRASWTSGIWAWSGKKKPRRDSVGSIASLLKEGLPEEAIVDDDEDWRKGDGGSPPCFKAIFLATRIITPDPSSILSSVNIPANSLLAYLAHALVSNARDEGITAKDAPGRRRSRDGSRSRAGTIGSPDAIEAVKDKGYGEALTATANLGRSFLSTVSNATMRGTKAITHMGEEQRPSLLNRASSSRFPTTAVSQASGPVSSNTSPADTPLPSVELSSIVPDESRPPTVFLSRQNLGTFFQSGKVGRKMQTATRFGEEPLTDRFGFIYDIQHASMLKDASAAGTAAPMSLNGHMPEEGWIERRKSQPEDEGPKKSLDIDRSRSRTPERPTTNGRFSSPVEKRMRGSLVGLNPSPARPIAVKDHLTVSTRGSSSLQNGTSSDSPLSANPSHPTTTLPTTNASRMTVSSLLDQLTEIHDRQQNARMVEWDAFLKRRAKSRGGERKSKEEDMRWGPGLIGISQMGLSGKSGAEEHKIFMKLVRHGIPLAYRSDVWAECSGAKDLLVPGEYAEISSVHRDDKSPVLGEIEKDVGRTFPGNVFFGGDGPGVAKLRRVLIAYSWHNPGVGYCQGMNMLAATLLLTHTEEEQAYWVLLCVIERLLPSEYFSPSLLASRADQAVLSDLVTIHLPALDKHLSELGVDLASITFGWFLSLFTDCLPVETLFRVWDVFFVQGHETLFRVAIAILKLNETEIIACDSVADLFTFISSMTSRLWAADKLIALQHSYRAVIKSTDIAARCQIAVGKLQSEMEDS